MQLGEAWWSTSVVVPHRSAARAPISPLAPTLPSTWARSSRHHTSSRISWKFVGVRGGAGMPDASAEYRCVWPLTSPGITTAPPQSTISSPGCVGRLRPLASITPPRHTQVPGPDTGRVHLNEQRIAEERGHQSNSRTPVSWLNRSICASISAPSANVRSQNPGSHSSRSSSAERPCCSTQVKYLKLCRALRSW